MSRSSSQIIFQYEAECESVFLYNEKIFAPQDWIFGFWVRWTLIHKEVFKIFLYSGPWQNKIAENYEAAASELLRKRKGMISSLAQGLRRSGADHILKKTCARLISDHDAIFSKILNAEFESLKTELSSAYMAKKTLNAYAQNVKY